MNLKLYLKILKKNRLSTTLNISGLVIGITSILIIILYIQKEFSYDKYHKLNNQIYRICSNFGMKDKVFNDALTSPFLGELLSNEYPEILSFVRFQKLNNTKVKYENIEFEENNFYYVDSTIFEVFTYKLEKGNAKNCLDEISSIVLTEGIAKKYFGNKNPIGKILELRDGELYTVTGVVKSIPENTHLKFDALIPYSALNSGYSPNSDEKINRLADLRLFTYLLFPENYDIKKFENKFESFYEKYMSWIEKAIDESAFYKPIMQQLPEIHFGAKLDHDLPLGNKAYAISFMVIGIFVFLLVGINYINLTTAQATTRTKELMVKKTLGASKIEMIRSFMLETCFVVLLAVVLSIIVVVLLANSSSINNLIGLNFSYSGNNNLLFIALGIAITLSFFSSLYPAFYLSSVSPIGRSKTNVFNIKINDLLVRKILLLFQYVISVSIVTLTLLTQDQINFMKNKDLGFISDNVLTIPIKNVEKNKVNTFTDELRKLTNVKYASFASEEIGNITYGQLYRMEGNNGEISQALLKRMWVSDDYLNMLGVDFVKGRNFSRDFSSDGTNSVILNESAARIVNLEHSIGKKISDNIDNTKGLIDPKIVIGVVKDFHFNSLHNNIEPLAIILSKDSKNFLHIKIDGNNPEKIIRTIKSLWQEIMGNSTINYTYLSDDLNAMYKSDENKLGILVYLSFISIVISLIGLLGLSYFTANRNVKEMGIRKVLGASVRNILIEAYKKIFYLVVIAIIFAAPLTKLIYENWLISSYVYKAGFNFILFIYTSLGAVIISFIMVAYPTYRKALINPIYSLRDE